jgi:hypothetical protein
MDFAHRICDRRRRVPEPKQTHRIGGALDENAKGDQASEGLRAAQSCQLERSCGRLAANCRDPTRYLFAR